MAKVLPNFEYLPRHQDGKIENKKNESRTEDLNSANGDNGRVFFHPNSKKMTSKPQRNEKKIQQRSMEITTMYANWAGAAGGFPIPLLDLVLVTGLQIRLASHLANIYGVSISKNKIKTLLAVLSGGGITAGSASLSKSFLGFGTIYGGMVSGSVAYLMTKKVGKFFQEIFESEHGLTDANVKKILNKPTYSQ